MVRTLLLLSLVLVPTSLFAQLPADTRIIEQPGAPLEITHYEAEYQESSRYSSRGIRHSVRYRNSSDVDIVAVAIGLISFDAWNEFLDRAGGFAWANLRPGAGESGAWVAVAPGDFSFLTGVAYVSRVRFEDGTIWEADTDAVVQELRRIETDFDPKNLEAAVEPPPAG